MTPAAPPTTPMSLAELEAKAEAARRELEIALANEARASVAVTDARQGLVLQRIPRRALLLVQRSLAGRQEDVAQAQSAVKTWEKAAAAERERLTAEAQRAKIEKTKALQLEQAVLETRIGGFLAYIVSEAAEIEAAVTEHNRERVGSFLGQFRGLSDFGAWGRVEDGVSVLRRFFPAPKPATPNSSKEG